ncbi:hypothetical protein H0Z60_07595 [Ectothiorhodospiraceae bacterium WFHF3C12]|nr:hypothetical protein [Ectothiorhodospiraceae bacterium WFHF3C12]
MKRVATTVCTLVLALAATSCGGGGGGGTSESTCVVGQSEVGNCSLG